MSSEAESNTARPSSSSTNKRSKSTTSYMTRSVTAFELHSHYSHRNIYPTFSSGYAIRQKYFPLRDHDLNERGLQRPKSSVNNLMKRSYTTALIRATSRKRLYDVSPKDELYEEELLNPKRSILTLMRIAMVYFGIEVLFSLETALAVPILLKLKVPESLYSFVYFLSPLFGFLFQPILGVMSDRCESRFGRRRPFIFILSIGAFIGASLILNGYLIGDWLGDPKLKIPYIAIILVGTGVTFLDFCADSTDSPLRAFLLDVCNPEDQDTGLNIHAILGGSGAALGFILGAIDWNQTFLHHLGDELQVLYVFSSVIFFIGLVVTLTSAKEIPIVLIKNNKERMPLIESANNLLVLPEEVFEEKDDQDKKDEESNHEEEEEDEEDFDQPITLKTLLHSILKMPKELIRLIICQTFGWIAYFSLTLFMTDFCGQSIYHGDPSAPEDSELFKKYNDGVKMGCWCLLVYSVTTAFSALLLENFLMKRFSTRTLYFFYFFIYAICTGCMYFQTNIYVIMPLCASIGVLLTSLTTLPYQMLSDFHKDKNFRNQSAAGTKRGLGVDCSLLSSCYFLSQTFTSAFMSFLTAAFGNYVIVIVASLFSFAGCLWISLFVIFPRECNQQTSKSDADGSIIKA